MTAAQPESPTEASARSTHISPSRYLVFATIAGAGCLLDLLSKHWVFQWRGLPGQRPIWWVWEGILGIETSLNTGALFGIGQQKVLVFAFLSCVAFVGILVWFIRSQVARDRFLTVTLACVTGGILGNLYDRLGLWSGGSAGEPRIYAVRDWIRISYHGLVWPNFNLADSLLVCGAILLVWHALRAPADSRSVDRSEDPAGSA